jgi:hypothetical protein
MPLTFDVPISTDFIAVLCLKTFYLLSSLLIQIGDNWPRYMQQDFIDDRREYVHIFR